MSDPIDLAALARRIVDTDLCDVSIGLRVHMQSILTATLESVATLSRTAGRAEGLEEAARVVVGDGNEYGQHLRDAIAADIRGVIGASVNQLPTDLRAEHATALRREEEKGYAKGLADGLAMERIYTPAEMERVAIQHVTAMARKACENFVTEGGFALIQLRSALRVLDLLVGNVDELGRDVGRD